MQCLMRLYWVADENTFVPSAGLSAIRFTGSLMYLLLRLIGF